jgi:hypothetical protein
MALPANHWQRNALIQMVLYRMQWRRFGKEKHAFPGGEGWVFIFRAGYNPEIPSGGYALLNGHAHGFSCDYRAPQCRIYVQMVWRGSKGLSSTDFTGFISTTEQLGKKVGLLGETFETTPRRLKPLFFLSPLRHG